MSEWVSVNDAIKPIQQDYQSVFADCPVLVTDGQTVCEAQYQIGGNHIGKPWEGFSISMINPENITHWRPLPEPPACK